MSGIVTKARAALIAVLTFILERVSPSTVEGALKVMHKAVAGLEKAEAAALAKTTKLDGAIQALATDRARQAAAADQARRVAGNLRAVIA